MGGQRKTKSWVDTTENRARAQTFAMGLFEGSIKPLPFRPVTLRTLWKRYSEAQFPLLRPRTRRAYEAAWRRWEASFPATRRADGFTANDLDRFCRGCRQAGKTTAHILSIMTVVRLVFRWATTRLLVPTYPFSFYRFRRSRNERTAKTGGIPKRGSRENPCGA
jgi:hypothetical protein